MKNCKNEKLCISGFTVIEILVIIITVISVGALIVWGVGFARTKFRDIKRNSDFNEIQKALDLYNNHKGWFPQSDGSVCLDGLDTVTQSLIDEDVLLHVVKDPRFPDLNPQAWPPENKQSCYYYESNGSQYFLGYCREGTIGSKSECFYVRK